MDINDIYTIKEIEEVYKISTNTMRSFLDRGAKGVELNKDYRKSGSTWLVAKSGLYKIIKNRNRKLEGKKMNIKFTNLIGENFDEVYAIYLDWRKVSTEMEEDGIPGNLEAGEAYVLEDFNNYAAASLIVEELTELEDYYYRHN